MGTNEITNTNTLTIHFLFVLIISFVINSDNKIATMIDANITIYVNIFILPSPSIAFYHKNRNQ